MKAILDLTRAIKNQSFYDRQFQDNGTENNILIVSPQLTAKHLYKYLLPYCKFYNEKLVLAITDLEKYNPYEQIVRLKHNLTTTEILWADVIIFPFTTHDLSKEGDLYMAIRETNPKAHICFYIDFNFYELTEGHPHYELFNKFPEIINQTERNIINADLVITHNMEFQKYLVNKFSELASTKYKDWDVKTLFGSLPYLIDEQILLQNIDFESHVPQPVINNKGIFKKISEAAEEVKKEDLKNNVEKSTRLNNSKPTPKKASAKTKKVDSKKTAAKKGAKGKEGVSDDASNVSGQTDGEGTPAESSSGLMAGQGVGAEAGQNTAEGQNNVLAHGQTEEPEAPKIQLPKKYRIGIICSISNYEDVAYYNAEFQKINELYGEQVSLIFIGYDYEEDKKKILDGVNFEYVKQVSIIHFFKQLKSLELDAVFVPIIKNTYNITSETYNKYLECSLFKIPIIVPDMFPYNAIMTDTYNGYIYKDKPQFLERLDTVLKNPDSLKMVGISALKNVMDNYRYTDENVAVLSDMFKVAG